MSVSEEKIIPNQIFFDDSDPRSQFFGKILQGLHPLIVPRSLKAQLRDNEKMQESRIRRTYS